MPHPWPWSLLNELGYYNLWLQNNGLPMTRSITSICVLILVLSVPANSAIDPVTGRWHVGRASKDVGRWERINFKSARLPLRNAAEIKVTISTKGSSMQGLIRVPGAPASNFDTGNGTTAVDLINVGNDRTGYAEIVALEILFTQSIPGQFYEVLAVEDGDQAE